MKRHMGNLDAQHSDKVSSETEMEGFVRRS